MIDLKKWLTDQNAVKNYDDPEIDPDKLVTRHKKAVAKAKNALRDHLQMQLRSALMDFFSNEVPEKKSSIV
ncbi:MAG: hypothetical protein Kow0029_31530 [Candidatus Rifleibacteriota bacterium]